MAILALVNLDIIEEIVTKVDRHENANGTFGNNFCKHKYQVEPKI